MQHLEEGTIHAWLDGALSDDEAAAVARHVDECAECSAMVAEARGLIAGASRIVGALDVVRAGVIPAAGAPTSRGSFWRSVRFTPARAAIAATLILAVGSLFTVRHAPAPEAGPRASVMRAVPMDSARVAQPTNVSAAPAAAPSERSKTLRVQTKGAADQVAAAVRPAAPAPAPTVARQDANLADRPALPKVVAGGVAAAPAAPAPPQAAPLDTLAGRREALRAAAGSGAAITEQRRARDSVIAKRLAGNVVQLSEVVATSAAARARESRPSGVVICYSVQSLPDWASEVPARFALDDSPVFDTSLTRRLVRRVTPDGKIDGPMAGSWWQPGSVSGGPLVTLTRPAPATTLTLALPVPTGVVPMDATLSDPARMQRVPVMRSPCTP